MTLKIDRQAAKVRVFDAQGGYVGIFSPKVAAIFPAEFRREHVEDEQAFLRTPDGYSVALVTNPAFIDMFAAAPEMLEALRQFVREASKGDCFGSVTVGTFGLAKDAIEKAERAQAPHGDQRCGDATCGCMEAAS